MSELSCIYFVTGLQKKCSVYLIILLERQVNILYGIIITHCLDESICSRESPSADNLNNELTLIKNIKTISLVAIETTTQRKRMNKK